MIKEARVSPTLLDRLDSMAEQLNGLGEEADAVASRVDGSASYEAAKQTRDRLEEEIHRYKQEIDRFPKGAMNLTSDTVKNTSEYKEIKRNLDNAFRQLQQFNSMFVKTYAKEIREERNGRFR